MEKHLPRQVRKALARAKYRETGKAKDAFQPIFSPLHPSGMNHATRRHAVGAGKKGRGLVGARKAIQNCGEARGRRYDRQVRSGEIRPSRPYMPRWG